jgi:hypothetical protein
MINHYELEVTARARIEEARTAAAQWQLVVSARRQRPSLRQTIGLALIKVGWRLAGEAPRYPARNEA